MRIVPPLYPFILCFYVRHLISSLITPCQTFSDTTTCHILLLFSFPSSHLQFALIASLLASRSATAGHSMVASSIDRLAREFAALSTENAHLVCVWGMRYFVFHL
jgi:hypothetical protein